MRHIQFWLCAGLLTAGAPHLAAQENCDRACLGTLLDAYLGAVVANAPERHRWPWA